MTPGARERDQVSFGDQLGETSKSGPCVIEVASLPSLRTTHISSCPFVTLQKVSSEPSGDQFGSQSSAPLVKYWVSLPLKSISQISP